MRTMLLGLATFAALAAATPAAADCYDVYGCTNRDVFRLGDLVNGPNCDFLYTMRNQIYAQHGLCFRTARAIAAFGNANCVSYDANRIGLNRFERENAATILRAEHALGCPE